MKEAVMNIITLLKEKRLLVILVGVLLVLTMLVVVDSRVHGLFGDGWHHSEFRAAGESIPMEAVGEAMEIGDGE